jgi:hypothetical protein
MFSLNTSARSLNIKDPPMETNFIILSSLYNFNYKSMLFCPAARDDSSSAQSLNVHIRDPQSGKYLILSHF